MGYSIRNNMSEAVLIPDKPRKQAEILDIIDRTDANYLYTKGGLRMRHNMMSGIGRCLLKPVTKQGEDTLNDAIAIYKSRRETYGKDYEPVTTLPVDSNPAIGGKRNKSKKPKRRNSRSKRRKTVSKRRR